MKKEFSIYLDLVRFLAAMVVLIFHSNVRALITEKLPFVHHNHAHAAVLVFFVLSGYVISYITMEREKNPIDYWSSRLSRFYSLAIPIVLLAPLLDLAGSSVGPQFYSKNLTNDLPLLRIIASLTFTNELWTLSIMSFSNTPYWSLCYEMPYYLMFAIAAFTKGRARVGLLLVFALFVGPKIIVMAPLWLLGVVLHRWQVLEKLSRWQGWLLFLGSFPLYFLFFHYDLTLAGSNALLKLIGPLRHEQAMFSKYFMTDYLLALIVAANFVGFRTIASAFSAPLLACEKPIRWFASFTFSLYILHQPFLQFYAAIIGGDPNGVGFYLEVMAATLITVFVLGSLTEHKREHLRDAIRKWLLALTGSRWWQRGISPVLAPKQVGG